jgi:hypothetical protein
MPNVQPLISNSANGPLYLPATGGVLPGLTLQGGIDARVGGSGVLAALGIQMQNGSYIVTCTNGLTQVYSTLVMIVSNTLYQPASALISANLTSPVLTIGTAANGTFYPIITSVTISAGNSYYTSVSPSFGS